MLGSNSALQSEFNQFLRQIQKKYGKSDADSEYSLHPFDIQLIPTYTTASQLSQHTRPVLSVVFYIDI